MCVRSNIYLTSNSRDRYRVCLQIKSLKLSVVLRAAATWKGCLNKWNKCLFQTETWGTPRKLSFHNLKGHTGHLKKSSERGFWNWCLCQANIKSYAWRQNILLCFCTCGWRSSVCCTKSHTEETVLFFALFFPHRPLTCCNIRPISNSAVIKIEIFQ